MNIFVGKYRKFNYQEKVATVCTMQLSHDGLYIIESGCLGQKYSTN